MVLPALLALAPSAASLPLEAPVKTVTVYSDRARVSRTASVDVHGTRVVELPTLVRSVDPKTIAVSVSGAELSRVDIAWAQPDELPRARVEELLDALAKTDDQLAQLASERSAWQGQLSIASSLRPTLPPDALGRPQPRLNAAGWGIAVEFAHTRVAVAQAKLRDLTRRARPLAAERDRLVAEARKLDARTRPAGYRVIAHLTGHGSAKLTMTYVVSQARWRPIYDVQLQPSTSQLDVQLAGEVSQESGEDWSEAQLILSTAEPATATRYPKVTTWKVGERERFIPTPVAALPPPSTPPQSIPPVRGPSDDGDLRRRLSGYFEGREVSGKLDHGAYQRSLTQQEIDTGTTTITSSMNGESVNGAEDIDGLDDQTVVARDAKKSESSRNDDTERSEKKKMKAPEEPVAAALAPAPGSGRYHRSGAKTSMAGAPSESVGLVAPRGWSRPSYASDLPASLAGGYDLVFSALQPETVLSGKGTRRVALLSRRWPVAVERKLFPALAPDAFLVATLTSRDDKPLPGGRGQLFVGADPAGTAQLPLIRPGEPVTLPLGLDRAIRPIRNVKVVTVERGVIGKDEVSEYTVTIEVANPYATALPVRIVDQVPLVGDTGSKNVEVKLLRAEPATTTRNDKLGTLEWALQLPASGKTTLSFVYSIRRPKGFQLRQ